MFQIKSIGFPPAGTHWSYGAGFMRQVTRATAHALLAEKLPLNKVSSPPMGYETVVDRVLLAPIGEAILAIQNIAGDYYVCSCNTPVTSWPETFGVEVT